VLYFEFVCKQETSKFKVACCGVRMTVRAFSNLRQKRREKKGKEMAQGLWYIMMSLCVHVSFCKDLISNKLTLQIENVRKRRFCSYY
jgi:hypothetical protein